MALLRRFILTLLVVVAHAHAETASPVQAEPEATAAVFAVPDVWPWGYQDEQGAMQGSLIELIDRLSELSGVPIRAQLLPLRRVILDVLRGRAEFAFLFQSPDLDENAIPIDTVLQLNLMLMAMADTDYPLTLESLAGDRVGYARGTYLGESFEADEAVIKVPVYNIPQAVEMLTLGRISAVLASDHNLSMTLEAYGFARESFRWQEHVRGQMARLYMSRYSGSEDHARRFREVLQQMRDNGELQRIFQTTSPQ
ncbi:MAG: bacterial extracellular solute-binding protein [Marinobacter excellens HL-55]|uniref:Bacterial extracellular solute-binding protein n=1 Tax=Marinobacter excellens HL-55 TaxID=1305731 RepID=A0A0P7Z286_9GAMM|nr:MAG: bacterial extracellular solute-binding protein [Marinobacter excellens HL-55]